MHFENDSSFNQQGCACVRVNSTTLHIINTGWEHELERHLFSLG